MNPQQPAFGGGGAAAPSTLSLAHFDGTDGASTTTDEVVGVSWTLTSAQLDTAQKQFGTASLEFLVGEEATVNYADAALATYTVECFFRLPATGAVRILDGDFFLSVDQATSEVQWNEDAGGVALLATPTITADTWYHVAAVRSGTSFSLYFDGNRVDTDTGAATALSFTAANVAENSGLTTVWMDEFRFSNTARYSGATYTVPIAAFTVD
jgi:hypothetical protein